MIAVSSTEETVTITLDRRQSITLHMICMYAKRHLPKTNAMHQMADSIHRALLQLQLWRSFE